MDPSPCAAPPGCRFPSSEFIAELDVELARRREHVDVYAIGAAQLVSADLAAEIEQVGHGERGAEAAASDVRPVETHVGGGEAVDLQLCHSPDLRSARREAASTIDIYRHGNRGGPSDHTLRREALRESG